MPTGTVYDWGNSVYIAFSTALNNFIAAIPAVIGALLILIIGWILSNILARVVDEVLERLGADRIFAEQGGREMFAQAGATIVPSDVAAVLVKWVIRLIFLVAAANVLGLTQVSVLLNQVILWIPNLIVAAVVLMVAPLIGRFLRRLIEVGAGQMGFANARLLGRLAEIAVIAFAVIIAINQVGIASDLVRILFIGIVGALSLAFGLAFGLGGRDVAARLTEQWYGQSQDAAGRIATASTTGGGGGGSSASAQTRSGTTPRPGMRSSVEPTTRRPTSE
jgi:mechanosensitive ion channel-like protein